MQLSIVVILKFRDKILGNPYNRKMLRRKLKKTLYFWILGRLSFNSCTTENMAAYNNSLNNYSKLIVLDCLLQFLLGGTYVDSIYRHRSDVSLNSSIHNRLLHVNADRIERTLASVLAGIVSHRYPVDPQMQQPLSGGTWIGSTCNISKSKSKLYNANLNVALAVLGYFWFLCVHWGSDRMAFLQVSTKI
ncbi:hypothetical protein V1478_005587 [Vespula squamosa]|uniref:Uncharacterized protein n=1 Tax=Vespula squamosa TaxID=30214 RepID=A0ABD2BAI3_VESSQ